MAASNEYLECQHYVELSLNPIRFEPISKLTSVYFDGANVQVFTVRSGGTTGVTVKGTNERSNITFRLEDKGKIQSIKFSPDMRVLAIQRSNTTVEFINFIEGMDVMEYSQACKGKSSRILGVSWTSINEIVFVTDHGVELYQVFPEKRTLKVLKTYNTNVNWYVYLPETSALLLSTSTVGNVIVPFFIKGGTLTRVPKFEVDIPVVPKPPKLCLLERDVSLAKIYNQLFVIVLRQQQRIAGQPIAEVCLYQLHRESPARKTDILRLDMSGRFAVNIVDNLIIVHHQASKTSMIFDIKLSADSDGYVNYHYPVCSQLSIKPFTIQLPPMPTNPLNEPTELSCELYSSNWIVFHPNIVIDAKWGCLWFVQVNLYPIIELLSDRLKLVDFLRERSDSKQVLLHVCRKLLVPGLHQCSLKIIAQIFDKLSAIYKSYLDTQVKESTNAVRPHRVVIDQSDMYTHVLSVFVDSWDKEKYKFVVAVLMEYIRSLNQFHIPVQHFLHELIINTLVKNGCFYQLHQLLQYHVLNDSKPLACLLLSLENTYPPAHQLALDMLKRLSTANEEIIEVLLSTHQLLPALRFVRSVGQVDTISARKFLEGAMATQDKMLFYNVFKFFEQRNVRLRGKSDFARGEYCELYVKYFVSVFGADALGLPAAV